MVDPKTNQSLQERPLWTHMGNGIYRKRGGTIWIALTCEQREILSGRIEFALQRGYAVEKDGVIFYHLQGVSRAGFPSALLQHAPE